jgi:hypothetical protein
VRSAEGHARHETIACGRHTAEPPDRNGDVAMTLTAADGAIAIPRSRSPARPDLLLGRRASGATGRVPRSAREGSPSQMPIDQGTPKVAGQGDGSGSVFVAGAERSADASYHGVAIARASSARFSCPPSVLMHRGTSAPFSPHLRPFFARLQGARPRSMGVASGDETGGSPPHLRAAGSGWPSGSTRG